MRALRAAHLGLLQRVEGRGQGLREQLQCHQLEREALLLETWLASRVATAESQDLGRDLEAVKVSLSRASRGQSGWRLSQGKGGVCAFGREGGKGVS